MELMQVKTNNAIHKIVKQDSIYTVISKFENDFGVESFEYDNFENAKKHIDDEVKLGLDLLNQLEDSLLKALELSQNLNLDIASQIDEILNSLNK